MNFKNRIRVLERNLLKLSIGLSFDELLQSESVHKGKSFDSFDDLKMNLRTKNLPNSINDDEALLLIKKGLLNSESQFAKELLKRKLEETFEDESNIENEYSKNFWN